MEHINSYNEHFTIGEKIKPKNNPTNVYKLVVNNMSGDADGYEKTKTFFKKDNEDLIKELIDMCEWAVDKWPSREDIELKYRSICDKYGYDYYDFGVVTYDNYGDCLCRPYFTSLTWFDENGEEYQVNLK